MTDELSPDARRALEAYKGQILREEEERRTKFQITEEQQRGGKIGFLKAVVGKDVDLFFGLKRYRGKIMKVDGKNLTVYIKLWGMNNIIAMFDIRKVGAIIPCEAGNFHETKREEAE